MMKKWLVRGALVTVAIAGLFGILYGTVLYLQRETMGPTDNPDLHIVVFAFCREDPTDGMRGIGMNVPGKRIRTIRVQKETSGMTLRLQTDAGWYEKQIEREINTMIEVIVHYDFIRPYPRYEPHSTRCSYRTPYEWMGIKFPGTQKTGERFPSSLCKVDIAFGNDVHVKYRTWRAGGSEEATFDLPYEDQIVELVFD